MESTGSIGAIAALADRSTVSCVAVPRRSRISHPRVQLLYKSRHTRQKDSADFARVVSTLEAEQRLWLAEALRITAPAHAWIAALEAG
jgi:hypothetical protein